MTSESSSPSLAAFVTGLAAEGRHDFSTEEARQALGISPPAVRAALRRLGRRGWIAAPLRGFHVIVPPEYRRLGCLPPEHFVPSLMAHLGEPSYYAALLSAAQIHGAAHHRPQRFQVMVSRNRKPIACGEVRVEFIARRDLDQTPTVERNTPRGTLRVSSIAATALEMVGYAHHCGGLDNVATVLSELADGLDSGDLVDAAQHSPMAWSQRLGHLLDLVGHQDCTRPLAAYIAEVGPTVAPLVRSRPPTGAPRSERWKLAINARVEADL